MLQLALPVISLLLQSTFALGGQETNNAQPTSTSYTNGPQSRECWGEFDINTNYYDVIPNTGNTVEVLNYNSNLLSSVLFDSR
jgi:hypothetical protein